MRLPPRLYIRCIWVSTRRRLEMHSARRFDKTSQCDHRVEVLS